MAQIIGIRRLDETIRRSGGSGDNWHMTWANDDQQYVSLCDGSGWPDVPGCTSVCHNSRVFRIKGDPPNIQFEYLPNYPDLFHEDGTPRVNRYYGFGIIAIDGYIYQFLSTPNRIFSMERSTRFVGVKLIYSPNNGQDWKNQDGSAVQWETWEERNLNNMLFFNEPDESFSLLTVLQMGKNYEANKDGYVYIYAPNGNLEGNMNQLVMFRVPKQSILDRASYEYFVSRNSDGTACWSKNINRRGIVHEFPSGWVNTKAHPYAWHPSIVYNAALKCYMMVNWGMGCSDDGILWFGKPSYLGFWIAEKPWGPWTQIHEETAWTPDGDLNARAYQPQISPKWIAKDGQSFWLVFTDFQDDLGGDRPNYCFKYQKVEILT